MDSEIRSAPPTLPGLGSPVISFRVKEVWMPNVGAEFNSMRELLTRKAYTHISVSVKHLGDFDTTMFKKEVPGNYETVKKVVNLYPPVQIAFTIFDAYGKISEENCITWKFNMKLCEESKQLTDHMIASALNFEAHRKNGIDYVLFSELLASNRIVSNGNFVWLGFNSGPDFGYLITILTTDIPDDEPKFMKEFNQYFQKMYDVRYLMTACKGLSGGQLDATCDTLNVVRVGPQFSVASDSRLIGRLFFKMKDHYFQNKIADYYCGSIYNLGTNNETASTKPVDNINTK